MQSKFTEFDEASKKGMSYNPTFFYNSSTLRISPFHPSPSISIPLLFTLFVDSYINTGGKVSPSREEVVAFMEVFKKLVLALIELGHLKVKLDQTGMPLFSSFIPITN